MLYYLAENLSAAPTSSPPGWPQLTGVDAKAARDEVDAVDRAAVRATPAWPTSSRARVHQPPARAVTLALHEPVGVIGIVAPDEAPLLGLISLVAPALAMGNTRRRRAVASAIRCSPPTSTR